MISRGDGGGSRAEADRWLVTAEKLLASGDSRGAKSFAIRACETDPSSAEAADYILAICDTLLAGETRIGGASGDASFPDLYAVLRLDRLSRHDPELIAAQYRRLDALLNPTVNRLPFSHQAHKTVTEAWSVLSDPSRKALYDRELQSSQLGSHQPSQSRIQNQAQEQFTQFRQQQEHNQQQPSNQFQWQDRSKTLAEPPRSGANRFVAEEMPNLNNSTDSNKQTRVSKSTSAERKIPSFWTSCPYCLVLYEYPKDYEECILLCQNCRRAFEAVTVQAPPVTGDKKDDYFCSWSFFPLGFSGYFKPIGWSPVSPLFPCPKEKGEVNQTKASNKKPKSAPRIYYDDDDVYVEVSAGEDDDEDEDWHNEGPKKTEKAKLGKGKESQAKNTKKRKLDSVKKGDQNAGSVGDQDDLVGSSSYEVTRTAGGSGRKRTGPGANKNLGRLDLNVEFSNEVEEPAVAARGRVEGNGLGNREVDNIEGIGFFEGLDEFLNSLPILSVVADDKVKTT